MELKWLEDFTVLASTSSFTRAAELRHVTQSAFSRRIKQLEIWLGVTLVNRATFPAELTQEGQMFLPVAQETLRNFYRTRAALQPNDNDENRLITFSSLHTLTITFFPLWLKRMQEKIGQIRSRLSPDRGGIEQNIQTLSDGEVDFLLTYAHESVPFFPDSNRYQHHVLGHEKLIPVSVPDPRGRLIDYAVENEATLNYLSYGDVSFFGTLLTKHFEAMPTLDRRVVHQNTISVGLKSMALAGWGVAWLPKSLIDKELAEGKLVLASEDPNWQLTVEIRIYRHASALQSKAEALWQAAGNQTIPQKQTA